MITEGEKPSDLARRLPPGSYEVRQPVERSGLIFARVRHRTNGTPFEGGITPAADILSLHQTTFKGRAWRNGSLIHDGAIGARSLSLVKSGDQSDVRLTGEIDIVQVFLPPESISAVAAEVCGIPVGLLIEGWVKDSRLEFLVARTMAALETATVGTRVETDVLALKLAEHLVRHYGGRYGRVSNAIRYGGLSPTQLRRVLEFMDANLQWDVHLTDIAALAGLTPYHFLRSFHSETGLTPHQWLIRRRIARAKSLLAETTLPIAEIAFVVGYASQSAMTAAFSRLTGTSPKQWRMSGR